jgi:DNA-binding transcriptional LysR family regulator
MVSVSQSLTNSLASRSIQNSERGVQSAASPLFRERLELINWDDLQLFRGVADAGSLRRAAATLGFSINTVRARISRLEKCLGTTLFARDRHGLSLTNDGGAVLELAAEMKALSTKLTRGTGNNILLRDGELCIGASEGVGAFWLTPRLSELRDALPNINLALECETDQRRIHSNNYDICLGFERPSDPDRIVTKIATLHFMLFGSDTYVQKKGRPASFDDLDGHHYVLQNSPGLKYDSTGLFIGNQALRSLNCLTFNTSFSLYWAIINGLGIGAMPTYIRTINRALRPINLPVRMKFELWMSYDRSVQSSAPVRTAIDWLRDCFDIERYPWFRDNFVHPDQFEDRISQSKVVSLFDSFETAAA